VVETSVVIARIPADRGGQDALGAHRLRRADQVVLRAEVDRICRCQCSADRQKLTTSCGYEAESDCHYRGIVCALGDAKYVLAA
jgi:hypothetical protein